MTPLDDRQRGYRLRARSPSIALSKAKRANSSQLGGPNGIRTRVSVATTFSPAVSDGSWPHAPSEPDATKTCKSKFPETSLSRSLVQIGGPQPLAGKQVTRLPL